MVDGQDMNRCYEALGFESLRSYSSVCSANWNESAQEMAASVYNYWSRGFLNWGFESEYELRYHFESSQIVEYLVGGQ